MPIGIKNTTPAIAKAIEPANRILSRQARTVPACSSKQGRFLLARFQKFTIFIIKNTYILIAV
jgi:hypothetical protein